MLTRPFATVLSFFLWFRLFLDFLGVVDSVVVVEVESAMVAILGLRPSSDLEVGREPFLGELVLVLEWILRRRAFVVGEVGVGLVGLMAIG